MPKIKNSKMVSVQNAENQKFKNGQCIECRKMKINKMNKVIKNINICRKIAQKKYFQEIHKKYIILKN